MSKLLSREKFDELVKLRSHGKCVLCGKEATDAHHILDRKLFSDGGYYLDNGAALCADHHWDAELTTVTVEDIRKAAGIEARVLPPELDPAKVYDKWGNEVVSETKRKPGPLIDDEGCQRAMALGGVMWHLY
jgi:hypothetical protein